MQHDVALDKDRWERVYLDAFPRVYRALVATGARPDEAEDALHDAFERGFKTDSITSVEGWLFVVASRQWRRRRIRDRILHPFTAQLDVTVPSPSSDRVGLFAALGALPLRQRQVLVSRYMLGMSQEETAALLGIARGTVAATTTQAARAMRALMEAN
jgi:RNA polymerase sigma factor (sigma-70 family)